MVLDAFWTPVLSNVSVQWAKPVLAVNKVHLRSSRIDVSFYQQIIPLNFIMDVISVHIRVVKFRVENLIICHSC
jgi:hypothetical protein